MLEQHVAFWGIQNGAMDAVVGMQQDTIFPNSQYQYLLIADHNQSPHEKKLTVRVKTLASHSSRSNIMGTGRKHPRHAYGNVVV